MLINTSSMMGLPFSSEGFSRRIGQPFGGLNMDGMPMQTRQSHCAIAWLRLRLGNTADIKRPACPTERRQIA